MKHFAYRVYKKANNRPVFGGAVPAETMEDAVKKVIVRNSIAVNHVRRELPGYFRHYFTYKDHEVGILIYAREEDF